MSKVSDGTWEYTPDDIKCIKTRLAIREAITQEQLLTKADEALRKGDSRVLQGTAKSKRKQLGYSKFAKVCFNCKNYQRQTVLLLVNSTTAISPQQCVLGSMPVESNGTCDYWKDNHD